MSADPFKELADKALTAYELSLLRVVDEATRSAWYLSSRLLCEKFKEVTTSAAQTNLFTIETDEYIRIRQALVKGDRIRFLDGEYPVVGALYDRHGSVHWGGGGNPADHIKGTFITNFGRQGTAPNSGSQYDTPCGECFPLTGHMINILQITWKYPSLDGAGQPTYPAATLEMLGYFKKQFPLMNELRRLELLRGEADVNKEKLATLEKQRAAFADEQKEGQLRLQRFVSLEKTLREKLSAAARKLDEAANSIVDGVDTGCAETAKTLAKAAKEVIKETGL